MTALIVKEFRELARDRRTLAMLVILPVILLIILVRRQNLSPINSTPTVPHGISLTSPT